MYEFIQENLAFLIFILLLNVFLFIKRKDLSLQGKFPFFYVLMYRTKLGLDKMDRWSKKYPKTYLYLAYLCVFVGIAGMLFVFALMFWQLGFILDNNLTTGGGLVLPVKTDDGTLGGIPVFSPPFFEWLVALFILMVVHEFAHGVIGERFGVKIKSSGLAFFGSMYLILFFVLISFSLGGMDTSNFFAFNMEAMINLLILIFVILLPLMPGAFVEPDEKQLAKKPWWQQVAVMGAGSTSNFLFGFLFLGFWLLVSGPFIGATMQGHGLEFGSVMNQSSFNELGITSGELVSFNGRDSLDDILVQLDNLSLNQSYNVGILQNGTYSEYSITTFENPLNNSRAMIGISNLEINYENKEGFEFLGNFPLALQGVLFWIWFLNIAIGIMNLLPIWITDGGQIFRIMSVKYFGEKRGLVLNNVVSYISFILIIFTIFPSLLIKIIGLF